jgi:molecular chaperone DnaJ
MLMNHYLLLGLPTDADAGQIKIAYRRMAKRFHPDTNQGSEAAAELFRQLHEAYRVLSDPALRTLYDAKLLAAEQLVAQCRQTEQQARQAAKRPAAAAVEPQQKFNRFLNTLLGALFEEPASVVPQAKARERPVEGRADSQTRKQPDFNFYYYLAMEKKAPPYSCGADGVYRRNKPTRAQPVNRVAGFPRGGSLLLVFCSSLWNLFSP